MRSLEPIDGSIPYAKLDLSAVYTQCILGLPY